MYKNFFLIFILLQLYSFAPLYALPPNPLPKLLQEVEAKYKKSNTVSADFEQLNQDVAMSHVKKSSGKIFVKRPSKFRWETLKPDQSLLISDGSRYWFYTPPFDEGERGQVIEKDSSQVQSKLANALLSGSFSVTRNMTMKQKGPSTFLLIPKQGSAGTVTQATLEVDPNLKLIQKVTLEHKGGNRSEISLSKIVLGQKLDDSLFVFQIPPNTDQITE